MFSIANGNSFSNSQSMSSAPVSLAGSTEACEPKLIFPPVWRER